MLQVTLRQRNFYLQQWLKRSHQVSSYPVHYWKWLLTFARGLHSSSPVLSLITIPHKWHFCSICNFNLSWTHPWEMPSISIYNLDSFNISYHQICSLCSNCKYKYMACFADSASSRPSMLQHTASQLAQPKVCISPSDSITARLTALTWGLNRKPSAKNDSWSGF